MTKKKMPAEPKTEKSAAKKVANKVTRKATGEKWVAERVALKKIQVHFELQQSILHDVRVRSAQQDMNSSDYVRRVIGLSHAKIQRPRISLSFSDEDFRFLSERYDVDVTNRSEIKRRVQDDLIKHLKKQNW